MGVPFKAVNSRGWSVHSLDHKSPRSSRAVAWATLYERSSSTRAGEIFVERAELAVLGVSV